METGSNSKRERWDDRDGQKIGGVRGIKWANKPFSQVQGIHWLEGRWRSWAGHVGMFYLMAVFEHSIDPLGRYENQAIHGAGHTAACALKYGEGTVG